MLHGNTGYAVSSFVWTVRTYSLGSQSCFVQACFIFLLSKQLSNPFLVKTYLHIQCEPFKVGTTDIWRLCFFSHVTLEVVEFVLKKGDLLIKTAVYWSHLRTPSVVTDIFSLSHIKSLDRFLLLNGHSKMLPSNLQTNNFSQQLSTE